ncbi:TonB-dependent receptor [Hydrocarboniphaga effusa]|uniref:TonB-dependent receptor n=1 Tax=Hydrocarboniphaga effusa TaxID=243629 RepID=UPI0035B2418B
MAKRTAEAKVKLAGERPLAAITRRSAMRLALLAGLMSAHDVTAQEAPAEPPLATIPVDPSTTEAQAPMASSDEPAQIAEIVVTAQKRQQSLQDVPVSVTALGGDFIKETGAADLADASLYIPNVRVDADDLGSPQLFIRGFGTNAFNPSFESSVGFVQDEIYYGRPGYFTESMFDVERVEVLRGPQGTLFGKNTIAGVFNVTTKGPSDVFTADGRYQYGSNNSHRVEAGAGGMLNDWFGMRVSGLYRSEDGQLYNSFLDRDEEKLEQKAARGKLRFLLSDSVTTDVLIQGSETKAPFWPYQLYKLDADTRTYLSGFDPNIEDNPKDFQTEFNTPGFIEKGSETLGVRTQWDIGELGGLRNAQSVLMLAGSRFYIDQLNELDVSPADIASLDNHEDHKQFSAELRFSADADSLFGLGQKVEFVGGVFWYDSNYVLDASIQAGKDIASYLLTQDFFQLAGIAPGSVPGLQLPGLPILGSIIGPLLGPDYYQFDYEQDVSSYAAFGQMTWYLTDHWAITPGIRINRESKTVDASGTQHCPRRADTACIMAALLGANDYPSADQRRPLKRSETDVSPKIVLQYFGDNGINLFTSYTRGYKSGGFNALSYTGEDLEFKPEKAQTYELGAKTTFFDRTLRFNATLYHTRFEDLQVLALQGVITNVSNAAVATSKGLEADFMWITPFTPLRIMGSFGLLDASYDRYPEAPAPVRNPQTGALQLGATQDLGGRRIAFAPRQTATLTPTLDFPLFFGLGGQLAGDVIYQGDQYTDVDLDPNTHVPAYTLYNARLIVSNAEQTWSLAVGGTNLADKRVLNQVADASFFPGTYFAQQAAGRQLFAALSLRF